LNVNVPITGAINVTVNGPSTVDAATIGTTGAVVMGATNTFNGRTLINGAVLSYNDVNALGVNPGASTADRIIFNGGTLRFTGRGFTDMSNRGFRFEGSGGTIDVVEASASLRTDSITSQGTYRGDLVKVGAGTLVIEGTNAANANFSGLIDVREGTLRLNGDFPTTTSTTSITTTLLGTSNSYADGTIFRTGTNLAIQMGNRNDQSEWNIDEWMTFAGNNYVTVGTINTQVASTSPAGFPTPNNERPMNLNGIITIDGTTTLDVVPSQILRFGNGGSGYVTGNGDIIKDGQGQLEFRGNIPDWTGNLVIKQGRVYGLGQADVLGTGYLSGKTLTLGSPDRQGVAEYFLSSESAVHGWTIELNHDVNVVYNPVQTKRLTVETVANGGRNDINGNITLNDNLQLYINDANEVGGSQNYVNFNGQLKDGATTSGNIVFWGDDTGNANDNTTGRPYSYFVLNNNNSLWTGDAYISANSSYDQDQTSIVRLGHAQALTAANDVTMNYNSMLQVGGGARTIGSLTTNGGTGPYYGDTGTMNASANGSSEVIENAASTPGTLTITQSTPVGFEAVWDAKFRDGTLNSQFFAPGANTFQPSAALNIVKAGPGWATLTLNNSYTGTTTVTGGILQVGKNGVGDTGGASAVGLTANAGTTIAGTGVIQGLATINGALQPGDEAGALMGTLTVGNLTLGTTSVTSMQIQRATYNAANQIGYGDPGYLVFINGVPTNPIYSGMLNDPVTPSQHDKLMVLGNLTWGGGSQVTLVNNGYTPSAGDVFNLFDWASVTGSLNAGAKFRTGIETGTELNLFELGGNYRWDTTLLNSDGILVVTQAALAPTAAYWKGGFTGFGNVWAVSDGVANSNWTTDLAGTSNTGLVPGATTDVFVSAAINSNQDNMVLGADMSIKSLTVNTSNTANPAILQSTGGYTLTIAGANAITTDAGSSATTLNSKLALTAPIATIAVNSSNPLTITGAISGNAITKTGAGNLTLSGANTYAGDTTISAGKLTLGASNVIPDGAGKGNVSVAALSTLDLAGASETINGLSGAGVVDNGAATASVLTLGGNNQTSSFSGTIQNSGSSTLGITKTGTGVQTLASTNTYTGPTKVGANGGTLEISGSINGTSSVQVDPGGTLLLSGGSERVNDVGVTLAGATLAFANTLGDVTESLGILTLNGNSTLDFGTAPLTIGNTFDFDGFARNGFTLSVYNWSGTSYSFPAEDDHGNPQDRLLIGGAVSASDAAGINFYSDNGTTFLGNGAQIGFGAFANEIVPVPEPSSAALLGAAGLFGLIGFRQRRRIVRKERS
jgi:autotransporter-associated beta strand protein